MCYDFLIYLTHTLHLICFDGLFTVENIYRHYLIPSFSIDNSIPYIYPPYLTFGWNDEKKYVIKHKKQYLAKWFIMT